MLQSDRERHSSSVRVLQTELYQFQLRERELRTEIQEGKRLEELTATYIEEIKKARAKIKVAYWIDYESAYLRFSGTGRATWSCKRAS